MLLPLKEYCPMRRRKICKVVVGCYLCSFHFFLHVLASAKAGFISACPVWGSKVRIQILTANVSTQLVVKELSVKHILVQVCEISDFTYEPYIPWLWRIDQLCTKMIPGRFSRSTMHPCPALRAVLRFWAGPRACSTRCSYCGLQWIHLWRRGSRLRFRLGRVRFEVRRGFCLSSNVVPWSGARLTIWWQVGICVSLRVLAPARAFGKSFHSHSLQ